MLDKFEGNFPKLSKSNSVVVGKNIIYFKKIKSVYVCWDYKTKIKIIATNDKERLMSWLHSKEKEIEERLCKITTNTSEI